jgi:hypothetical protein
MAAATVPTPHRYPHQLVPFAAVQVNGRRFHCRCRRAASRTAVLPTNSCAGDRPASPRSSVLAAESCREPAARAAISTDHMAAVSNGRLSTTEPTVSEIGRGDDDR